MTREVFIIATAYLLGCFCTGYYLVRLLKGLDIRALFSGNVGSRNVGRLLGAKGFVVTLTGDGISLFARAMTPLSSYRFGDSAGWMELFLNCGLEPACRGNITEGVPESIAKGFTVHDVRVGARYNC